ncbi:hypothetical protein R1flu_013443 [Riccia fluitans]|uniref:Store-operated calcium entry-associated regulatory factor n=1 Tax=Riccia fluitans TaxID=41844 RepID=A0ABD1YDE3_9MARC
MEYNYAESNDLRIILWAIAIFWTSIPGVEAKFSPYAKPVSIDTVPSLVFHKWKLTNYRRNMPLYQLKCVSGCDFEPDWVKCFGDINHKTHKGPAWRCEAELPSHLQFSTLEIICETWQGYDSKDDNRILEGSCGLEYTLKHALPSIPLQKTNNFLSEVCTPPGEFQWNECQWLMLGIAMYACCYCLYQVVQSDLKDALIGTNQKTTGQMVNGRCRKCQSKRISFTDHLGDKHHSEQQNWQRETPLECTVPTEAATRPLMCPVSPACERPNLMGSPLASPQSIFSKKLDRPLRTRKRDDFHSPRP